MPSTVVRNNDLANLKGIGEQYASILDEVGVKSIKGLRRRNPAHLKKMIERRHGDVVGLSVRECETWVNEAQNYHPRRETRSVTGARSG
jgi:predicted flap endonuclease-1-like 5' DNA nuclease